MSLLDSMTDADLKKLVEFTYLQGVNDTKSKFPWRSGWEELLDRMEKISRGPNPHVRALFE